MKQKNIIFHHFCVDQLVHNYFLTSARQDLIVKIVLLQCMSISKYTYNFFKHSKKRNLQIEDSKHSNNVNINI